MYSIFIGNNMLYCLNGHAFVWGKKITADESHTTKQDLCRSRLQHLLWVCFLGLCDLWHFYIFRPKLCIADFSNEWLQFTSLVKSLKDSYYIDKNVNVSYLDKIKIFPLLSLMFMQPTLIKVSESHIHCRT